MEHGVRRHALEHLIRNPHVAAETFRHLLRALLRETTYLPDPVARSYYASHVLLSYRAYRKPGRESLKEVVASEFDQSQKQPPSSGRPTSQPPSQPPSPWRVDAHLVKRTGRDPHRQLDLLQRGKTLLRRLARANLGHEAPLMRVLKHTYGRTGPRKWSLWRDFLAPDEPANADAVRDLLEAQISQSLVEHAQPAKLKALILAQRSAGLASTWSNIPLAPDLNRTSARGLPLARKRMKNMIQKWQLQIRQRILLPLPAEENSRLWEIATGSNMHGVGPISRRPMPSIQTAGSGQVGANAVETLEELRTARALQALSSYLIKTDGVHHLKRRTLSRLYMRLYRLVPAATHHNGKLTVTFPSSSKYWSLAMINTKQAPVSVVEESATTPELEPESWMFATGTSEHEVAHDTTTSKRRNSLGI